MSLPAEGLGGCCVEVAADEVGVLLSSRHLGSFLVLDAEAVANAEGELRDGVALVGLVFLYGLHAVAGRAVEAERRWKLEAVSKRLFEPLHHAEHLGVAVWRTGSLMQCTQTVMASMYMVLVFSGCVDCSSTL